MEDLSRRQYLVYLKIIVVSLFDIQMLFITLHEYFDACLTLCRLNSL